MKKRKKKHRIISLHNPSYSKAMLNKIHSTVIYIIRYSGLNMEEGRLEK